MALQFSGSGQYLSRASILKGSAPLSFACWLNPADIVTNQTIFNEGSTTTSFQYFNASIATSQAMCRQDSTSGASAVSVAAPTLNGWNHYAVVFASNSSRLVYLNGVSASNATAIGTPTSLNITSLAAAFQGAGAINAFHGAIAFPATWSVALSASDVAALYNSGAGSDPRNTQTISLISFLELAAAVTPQPDDVTTSWTVTGAPTFLTDPFPLVPVVTQLIAAMGGGGRSPRSSNFDPDEDMYVADNAIPTGINPKFLNYLDGFLRRAEPSGINQSSFINHEFLRHVNRLTKSAKPRA